MIIMFSLFFFFFFLLLFVRNQVRSSLPPPLGKGQMGSALTLLGYSFRSTHFRSSLVLSYLPPSLLFLLLFLLIFLLLLCFVFFLSLFVRNQVRSSLPLPLGKGQMGSALTLLGYSFRSTHFRSSLILSYLPPLSISLLLLLCVLCSYYSYLSATKRNPPPPHRYVPPNFPLPRKGTNGVSTNVIRIIHLGVLI